MRPEHPPRWFRRHRAWSDVRDALTEVGVTAPGCVALGDIQGPHGHTAVKRAVHDHPHRVDGLVVGRGAVSRRTDHTVLGQHHVEIDRTGAGNPHAHDVPQTRVGLHLVLVDEEDGEIGVVTVENGACRLGRHPAGLAAGGGERGTLPDVPATVDPLDAGDLGIPEVATRLRIGVGAEPIMTSLSMRARSSCMARLPPARNRSAARPAMCIMKITPVDEQP